MISFPLRWLLSLFHCVTSPCRCLLPTLAANVTDSHLHSFIGSRGGEYQPPVAGWVERCYRTNMFMRSKNQFVVKLNVNTVHIHVNTISFDWDVSSIQTEVHKDIEKQTCLLFAKLQYHDLFYQNIICQLIM